MHAKEGESFRATIIDIKPVSEMGGKGNVDCIIAREGIRVINSWYPQTRGHGFMPGDELIITPRVEHFEGGGSVTRFELRSAP